MINIHCRTIFKIEPQQHRGKRLSRASDSESAAITPARAATENLKSTSLPWLRACLSVSNPV